MYKVDNNVRLHTGMVAKHLLKFIKTKIKNHPNVSAITTFGSVLPTMFPT